MFYANNELVKGIFLNGRNYNYLAFGFGKIIPEDRNSVQANLNLAYKYLNQYRIEYGTVKDGYENALVSPRFDKPDSNGVFHSPFTYYYNGNIIPTKEVNILITNGNYALSNALVYNDMNINGAINYFATNTDFQGHNVNVFPEKDNYQSRPLLNYEMLNNCSNFDLNINTRFSKEAYPTLYNCNNFSGNFKYVGNSDVKYPGFRGFLDECKDGIFNIDCTNMHGGGSAANVTNYYNFIGIQSCNNMKINITGSSWQVWPHDHSFTSNCNINTYNVISGFGYMNDCNFNVVLPKDSKPEMDKGFEFLNNAENCNYNLNALDSNLYNYRSVGYVPFFEDLNNCNLNLQVNNAVEFGDMLGGNFHNCNIVFDNIKGNLVTQNGWWNLYNCNITGNVEATSTAQGFIEHGDGLNINLNTAKSSWIFSMLECRNVNGNLVAGNMTYVTYSSYLNLNVSGEGKLLPINVEHGRFYSNRTNIYGINLNNCIFEINNSNDFVVRTANNCNFNMRNSVGTAILSNLNNVNFVERGGANYTITELSNCYNSWISANTVIGLVDNVYNTYVSLDEVAEYNTVNVHHCDMTGFPGSASYHTEDCTFRAPLELAQTRFRSYFTWANVWPHATPRGSDGWKAWYSTNAGLESTENLSRCYLNCNNASQVNDSLVYFDNNKNMITSLLTYFSRTVTVNLPNYATNIKLNLDCRTLNLGLFMAGPPHGLEYSSISANDIYCTTGNNYFVHMNYGTRIYCENFCNAALSPYVRDANDTLQGVILINNYQINNGSRRYFEGGLTRIGRINYQGGSPFRPDLNKGACLFINNALLDGAFVNNSLLFVGSNVTWTSSTKITIGNGLIVNKENWSSHASEIRSRMSREHGFAWNVWDSGPWGPQSLFDFCTNV